MKARHGWFAAGLVLLSFSSAAHDKRPVHKLKDQDFGCEILASGLRPWNPRDISLPKGIASKFLLWKTVRSVQDPKPATCSNLPPLGVMIRKADLGNLSRLDLVLARRDVVIHRAYSREAFPCGIKKPGGQFGAFWSFELPTNKPSFRKANAICNVWNNLSVTTSCTLKAGTVIAVGPTQSASCEPPKVDETCAQQPETWKSHWEASTHHQIFLNLFNRPESEISKFLTNCRVTPWTEKE